MILLPQDREEKKEGRSGGSRSFTYVPYPAVRDVTGAKKRVGK